MRRSRRGRRASSSPKSLPQTASRSSSRTLTRPSRGTELPAVLAGLGVKRVLVAGTATEMCVFQTALDARRSGFDVLVRGDASASLDTTNEGIALDYLERVLGLEVVRASDSRASGRILSAREHRPLRGAS